LSYNQELTYKASCSEGYQGKSESRAIRSEKEKIERNFADSKELHEIRHCRLRGLKKVSEQALLAAACQNKQKIATRLAGLNKGVATC